MDREYVERQQCSFSMEILRRYIIIMIIVGSGLTLTWQISPCPVRYRRRVSYIYSHSDHPRRICKINKTNKTLVTIINFCSPNVIDRFNNL